MRRLSGQFGFFALLLLAVVMGTLPTSNSRLVKSVLSAGSEQEGGRCEEQVESVDICRRRDQVQLSAPSDQVLALVEHPPAFPRSQLKCGAVEFSGHRLSNGQLAALRT